MILISILLARMEYRPLPRSFYSASADKVASALLGHWLIRNTPEGLLGGPIVETEAYLTADPACHGYPGRTRRNAVMFGPPGHAYVYLIYGFHHCVNAVCCSPGIAEAVLIRAIEPELGGEFMAARRPTNAPHALTSGPGKICQALGIDRSLDGADLCDDQSPLIIARAQTANHFRRSRGGLAISPRIGLTKAADLPLRFYLPGSPFLSRKPASG
jgi:DNA-3-methyladenine glycosylase